MSRVFTAANSLQADSISGFRLSLWMDHCISTVTRVDLRL